MNFVIACADPRALSDALGWLRQYFPRYYRSALGKEEKVEVGLIESADAAAGPCIVLATDEKAPRSGLVSIEGQRMQILAPTPTALKETVKRVLAVWDERFIYTGPLPWLEMFRRVGLAGKQLPARVSGP